MKVYLDDVRTTPVGWVGVKKAQDAIQLLKTGKVIEISLDHDLGDDKNGTGYDVILWIEEQVYCNKFNPPKIHVHSDNSSAVQKMLAGIRQIEKRNTQQEK